MAVTKVSLARDARSASIRGGSAEYTRVYNVVTDSKADSEYTIRFANDGTNSIPQPGQAHPDDSDAVVVDIQIDPKSNAGGTNWTVTVRYSDDAAVISGSQQIDTPPLQRPVEYSFGGQSREIPLATDRSSPAVPIVNSLGEPFDPVPTDEEGAAVLQIVRNEATMDPLVVTRFRNSVNGAQITIFGWTFDPGQCLLSNWNSQLVRETYSTATGSEDAVYWRSTYEITIREDGHQLIVPNMGTLELSPDLKLVPIVDDEGAYMEKPQLISVATGAVIRNPTSTDVDANLLTFNVKPAEDWSLLGLPG